MVTLRKPKPTLEAAGEPQNKVLLRDNLIIAGAALDGSNNMSNTLRALADVEIRAVAKKLAEMKRPEGWELVITIEAKA